MDYKFFIPDNFILLDTEYTSWEGSQQRRWSLKGEHRELIQVSALKIKKHNNNLIIISKFNELIKPTINPILSNYIIKLTGITQSSIDSKGLDFDTFLNKFYNFSNDYIIYSYGNDYSIIQENLILNDKPIYKYYNWHS